MNTPPLLIGAALLFWGWQTGHPFLGAAAGAVLESSRWIKVRWEASDQELFRVWNLCFLLLLGTAIFAFTETNGPSETYRFFRHPTYFTQHGMSSATGRAVLFWLDWLPLVYFPFMAVQVFGSRERIPLETVSLWVRQRNRRARRLGLPVPPQPLFNPAYPFFGVCLLAASLHAGEDTTFFWGAAALTGWVLWMRRSRRFSWAVWSAAMAIALTLGYFGQNRLRQAQAYFDTMTSQVLARLIQPDANPSHSRTTLGRTGRLQLSDRIVIRVYPHGKTLAPALLREASYYRYANQVWSYDKEESDYDPISETALNNGIWPLLAGRTNGGAPVTIATYLSHGRGVLPLPQGSMRLEKLGAYLLHKNELGTVLAEGPGLILFDAFCDPDATLDVPPLTNDLQVSSAELPALKRVIAEEHLSGLDHKRTLEAVYRLFQEQFTYSLWQRPAARGDTNSTPVGDFLLTRRTGHCEYFATATVLLLRQLGIPARYAVGYSVHEPAASGYVVRLRDAHAWCLVWDDASRRWVDFDACPPGWSAVDGQKVSDLRFLSDFWAWLKYEFLRLWWGQSDARQYMLWLLGMVMSLLLLQILRRRRRARSLKEEVRICPGLDSEFYLVEKALAGRGLARRPEETLADWLARVTQAATVAEIRPLLDRLLRLHYRYRFDPRGLPPAEREFLRQETRRCLKQIKRLAKA
jgi:protein-glutamine gamma-glutamyltransferase